MNPYRKLLIGRWQDASALRSAAPCARRVGSCPTDLRAGGRGFWLDTRRAPGASRINTGARPNMVDARTRPTRAGFMARVHFRAEKGNSQ